MSILWLIALLAGGVTYTRFVLRALRGIHRLGRIEANSPVSRGSTSVIIAARNEEDWIGGTIESLLVQQLDFSRNPLEIIIVDDRSGDRTSEIVESYARKFSNIKLVKQKTVPPDVSPKKAALALGISQSQGEVILLTDADCLHDPGWVKVMCQTLAEKDAMAIGQARFIVPHNAPLWQRLQALDFAAQGVLSAGLVAAGTPYNCSGASLAFTREAFNRVGGWVGFDQFISGDDELLMRRFIAHNIPVIASTGLASVVMTRPPVSLTELWHQRTRWGSKTLHYPADQKAVLSGIFVFYLALSLTPLFALSWPLFIAAIAAFNCKVALDRSLIIASQSLYGDKFRFGEFFLTELLHPPVIVVLAILGAFGSFDWKGTTYKTKGTA